jgi:hypothetical protein
MDVSIKFLTRGCFAVMKTSEPNEATLDLQISNSLVILEHLPTIRLKEAAIEMLKPF